MTGRPPPKLLLTADEAAAALSVCLKTLWNITSPRGDLHCVRIGRSVRYYVDDLEAWIAAHRDNGHADVSDGV